MIGRVTGVVKPTRSTQNFVFVQLPDGADVFVHKTVLQTYGKPVVTGATVVCEAVHIPGKGYRATEIYYATPPADVQPLPWVLATIKYVDTVHKGYGFVILADGREAFLHIATIQRSRFQLQGDGAGLRVEVQIARSAGRTPLKVVAVKHTTR